MTLYLEATTTIPDLFIDYIEVRLASGESASLNWDESEIYRNPDGFGAKYTGVYFGEEPANGRLDELRDMVITDIGLYSDTIPEIEFVDNGRSLEFSPPIVKHLQQQGEDIECMDDFWERYAFQNTGDRVHADCGRRSARKCCGQTIYRIAAGQKRRFG